MQRHELPEDLSTSAGAGGLELLGKKKKPGESGWRRGRQGRGGGTFSAPMGGFQSRISQPNVLQAAACGPESHLNAALCLRML